MRLFLVASLAFAAVAAAAFAEPTRWSVDEWRADLAYLHDQIKTLHANPYHRTSEAELDAAFVSLHEAIPSMSDAAIAIEIQRILASLGDGHSHFRFSDQGLVHFFPIRLEWFEDGIYIIESKDGESIGRVQAIDGTPIEEVIARVTPYISRDNEMGIRAILPSRLRMAEFLHALAITENPREASFLIADVDGQAREATLHAEPWSSIESWSETLNRRDDLPLYRRDNQTEYWYEPLLEEGVMYMQFNSVQPMEGQHLGQFSDEMLGYMDENGLECLVIDIRHNGGGDGNILGPFVRRLSRHERINRPGHLYLITGPRTFSAALILTLRLERETEVLIAGEAGRGKPNSYSETGAYELPNTGLGGSVSALFREDGDPDDDRMMVPPDIPATISFDDYREGRDPVLEAVLARWRSVRGE